MNMSVKYKVSSQCALYGLQSCQGESISTELGAYMRHCRRAHKPAYCRLPYMCSDTYIDTDTQARTKGRVHTYSFTDNVLLIHYLHVLVLIKRNRATELQ